MLRDSPLTLNRKFNIMNLYSTNSCAKVVVEKLAIFLHEPYYDGTNWTLISFFLSPLPPRLRVSSSPPGSSSPPLALTGGVGMEDAAETPLCIVVVGLFVGLGLGFVLGFHLESRHASAYARCKTLIGDFLSRELPWWRLAFGRRSSEVSFNKCGYWQRWIWYDGVSLIKLWRWRRR
jgi:hypothetical protein